MPNFEKLKQYLLGHDAEEPSWLFYFIVSSIVSGVLGIIVKLIVLS